MQMVTNPDQWPTDPLNPYRPGDAKRYGITVRTSMGREKFILCRTAEDVESQMSKFSRCCWTVLKTEIVWVSSM